MINLLRDRQTQKIIGHRLQGVLYKTQQDDILCYTLYRVSQEEWTKFRESVPYVEQY